MEACAGAAWSWQLAARATRSEGSLAPGMVSSGRLPAGGTPVLSGASARRAALCTESRRGRSPAWAEADGRRVWQGRGRRSLRPGKPGRPAPRPPIPGAAQPRGRRGDRAKPRELGKVAVAPRSVEHRSSVPP